MQLGKLVKAISFIAGVALALCGFAAIAMAASGAVTVGTTGAYVAGGSFLFAAAPLLAVPFSIRIAKVLGLLVLLAFAADVLWLAFGSSLAPDRNWKFQAAAIAFAGLLLFRLWLARRGKGSRLGT